MPWSRFIIKAVGTGEACLLARRIPACGGMTAEVKLSNRKRYHLGRRLPVRVGWWRMWRQGLGDQGGIPGAGFAAVY